MTLSSQASWHKVWAEVEEMRLAESSADRKVLADAMRAVVENRARYKQSVAVLRIAGVEDTVLNELNTAVDGLASSIIALTRIQAGNKTWASPR